MTIMLPRLNMMPNLRVTADAATGANEVEWRGAGPTTHRPDQCFKYLKFAQVTE